MEPMHIFVSHSHHDEAFCRELVAALRGAGTDVWYDEHNLGQGHLMQEIMRELRRRPVFIVILSKDAFASQWVADECSWAYNLLRRDPQRIILPVTAAPIEAQDFDTWLYLENFKRIEALGFQPYSIADAIRRTLHALALTTHDEAPPSTVAYSNENPRELIARGNALLAQYRYADALVLFEDAVKRNDTSFSAWFNLSSALLKLDRLSEALSAIEHSLSIDPSHSIAWRIKGVILHKLKRFTEALTALDRAIAINSTFATAWRDKGHTLIQLKRYDEALAAFEKAFDPAYSVDWVNMGWTLYCLQRYEEALKAYDRAITMRATAKRWATKASILHKLGRVAEAQKAEQQAMRLD